MKIARLLKAAAVMAVAAFSVFAIAGCSAPSSSSPNGVAAVVNGHDISEQTVTDEVQHIRAQSGLNDDEMWGKFLVQNDMTPETVRENAIDTLVEQQLIQEGAEDLQVTVEAAEVDQAIDNFKQNFNSDESWKSSLQQAGFTEETYRETIDSSMTQQKISEHFQADVTPTDEDYVEAAKTYASYYDGAKRSSHILISVDDVNDEQKVADAKAQAEDILARINSGSLDFAAAAREYSGDEASKENGGDVGWDKLNNFVTEYTTALEGLEQGQTVSEPVQSSYGFHIIRVTDVFNAPEADSITSLDQIPEDFRGNIMEMAVSVKANTRYSDWLAEIKEAAEIDIKPMPEGLPYDIDLEPYREEAAEDEAADSSTDAGTDGSASDGTTGDATDAAADGATADGGETIDISDAIVSDGTDAAGEGGLVETPDAAAGDTAQSQGQ